MSYATLSRKTSAAAGRDTSTALTPPPSSLRIGAPNDSFEQEADRVADAVMTGGRAKPSWSFSSMSMDAPLQRKCDCGGSGGECAECKEKETLQRKAAGAAQPGVAPPIVHEVLNSPGHPLDRATRSFFEPRFGQDFSQVRIHADESAAESARAVNAHAYTVGSQLVFGSGHFAPKTTHGKKLLAHELSHVIQQAGQGNHLSALSVTSAHDRFEQEANHMADTALSGHRVKSGLKSPMAVLQRQAPPSSPGPPEMQGPDWGLTCGTDGCKFNTPAGDAPLSKDHYRCYLAATQGQCPPECKEELRGGPFESLCDQRSKGSDFRPDQQKPTPLLPACPPGQISYSGKCLPLRFPPVTQPPSTQPPSNTSTRDQVRVPSSEKPTSRIGFGTIASETLDNFPLAKPTVPAEHDAVLDHLVSLLNVYREVEVHIEGHTDGSGTEAINTPLSRARAQAVKKKLIDRHVVNPGRLRTEGFSSHQPLVPPSEPGAQEPRNRRVEIWYYTPPSKALGEGLRLKTNP